MKVKGLNGKIYTWKLQGKIPFASDVAHRSSLHLLARDLLKELFPFDNILEEVSLPGSDGLTADFVIPLAKLMIEVHGEQHYKFIPYFHQNILGFIESKKRDRHKIEWATVNNMELVELPYNESREQWRTRIIDSKR